MREALRSRSSSACELRLTVTAERQLGAVGGAALANTARLLGAETRYVLGSVCVGLAELLHGGADLVEQPLPLLGKDWDKHAAAAGITMGVPPKLVVSVSAVAALAAVAAGLPRIGAGGALRPAAGLIAERARLAARLQAAAPHAPRTEASRPSRMPPSPPRPTLLTCRAPLPSPAVHPFPAPPEDTSGRSRPRAALRVSSLSPRRRPRAAGSCGSGCVGAACRHQRGARSGSTCSL